MAASSSWPPLLPTVVTSYGAQAPEMGKMRKEEVDCGVGRAVVLGDVPTMPNKPTAVSPRFGLDLPKIEQSKRTQITPKLF